MYAISVEATFNATHRVHLPDGSLEPLHGHDWHVRAHFESESLDAHAMVVDFVDTQQKLRDVVTAFHHTCLNDHPRFTEASPTAEVVARVLFDSLRRTGLNQLVCVEVTEAPGCIASYRHSD